MRELFTSATVLEVFKVQLHVVPELLDFFFGLNCMVVNNIQLQNHSVSKQCSGRVAPSPNKAKPGLARVGTYMVDIIG